MAMHDSTPWFWLVNGPAAAAISLSLAMLSGCDASTDTTGTGAGGQGGQGGGSGAAGGGGSGGGTSLTPEVERCLFVNACEADGGTPVGMQACLAHAYERQWHWASYGEYRLQMEAMECRLAAQDCAGVRACDSVPQDFDAACAATPGETLCVDDTWVTCDFDGAATSAFDCGAAGKSCNVDVWAGCGIDACTFGATPNSCDPSDANVLILCSPAGFLERVDCARENNFVQVHGTDGDFPVTIAGEICGDDPMLGDKGCVGQGDPCDFFSQACEGDELVTCAGGTLARRDCASLDPVGQSCGFVTDGPFAGGAACGVVESDCDPTAPETCTDGVVAFCAAGRAQTVVCTEAGFAGCDSATVNGGKIAFCTP